MLQGVRTDVWLQNGGSFLPVWRRYGRGSLWRRWLGFGWVRDEVNTLQHTTVVLTYQQQQLVTATGTTPTAPTTQRFSRCIWQHEIVLESGIVASDMHLSSLMIIISHNPLPPPHPPPPHHPKQIDLPPAPLLAPSTIIEESYASYAMNRGSVLIIAKWTVNSSCPFGNQESASWLPAWFTIRQSLSCVLSFVADVPRTVS